MLFSSIQGATPIHDSSGLLISWIRTMNDLNRVEAENISFAQKKYLRKSHPDISIWFHIKELRMIHKSMFGNVWAWAGTFRKSVTSIGVKPEYISLHIAELCKEIEGWSKEPVELTFLEKSARIHHRLVQIHPFENGNGRFSRFIADKCLISWKCSYPIWPGTLNNECPIRKTYIQTLKAADKGNYHPLISLMKDFGASDPTLENFLIDPFYRSFLQEHQYQAKIRAFSREKYLITR